MSHSPLAATTNSIDECKRFGRIDAIDLARGVALIAMTTFHFGWDLEMFGFTRPGFASQPWMIWYARLIASSFLFLVGISFVLAHYHGFNSRGFLKRLFRVGGAALVITVATYFATPDIFIFFGILHHIALASVLALVFVHLPVWALLLATLIFFSGSDFLSAQWFNRPWLSWSGLNTIPPRSSDYVPIFPFFSAVLLGLAFGKWGIKTGAFARIGDWQPKGAASRLLRFLGQNSLVYYLIHQPILISILFAVQWIVLKF